MVDVVSTVTPDWTAGTGLPTDWKIGEPIFSFRMSITMARMAAESRTTTTMMTAMMPPDTPLASPPVRAELPVPTVTTAAGEEAGDDASGDADGGGEAVAAVADGGGEAEAVADGGGEAVVGEPTPGDGGGAMAPVQPKRWRTA